MRGKRAKPEERGLVKRQQAAVRYRMATLRTSFLFAAPGKVDANSERQHGEETMATTKLVVAPKAAALG
jgi:hypothetical protein